MSARRLVVSTVGQRSSPTFTALHAEAEARVTARGFDYEWRPRSAGDSAVDLLRGAAIGIVDVESYDASVLEALAPHVELLVRFGVGYDSVDLEAAQRHGIKVGRTPGSNARAVAEMTVLLMLATRRRLLDQAATVRTGEFASQVTPDLAGATVGIVGYGAVGRAVARLLGGFGCDILVHSPRLDAEDATRDGVTAVALDDLVASSDVVTLHLPATHATRHLISRDVLERMRPTSTLVNTSRGALVDEDALVDALREGRIGGAGLDVFAQEPLPTSSALLEAPNVVLTPHTASQTSAALRAMFEMALDVVDEVERDGTSPHLLTA